ncbi:MAG: cobalamin biosynthesis protein CobD [Bacilli bacterium]|nr:cobalamin biosynthesis protein CobD [Bacilli bacterium]
MLLYSFHETAMMLIAAILIDWLIGDPAWPTHPVIYMGKLIRWLEGKWRSPLPLQTKAAAAKFHGVLLTLVTVFICCGLMWLTVWLCRSINPWLGYAVNTWFISTTIAIKGLKAAALLVYRPLRKGDLIAVRKYVGYIVGRDTAVLDEQEAVRATIETVAENIVDAVVSPLFYALLGGAPLAVMYRASNTLDSMVGYKNETYLHFGWASARLDDLLNWVPARMTGLLLVISAIPGRTISMLGAWKSMRKFAHLHPSPNSGIPESAVAGALGIELGGRNYYGGIVSDRARMGWPLRSLGQDDILWTITLLYRVSYLWVGGLLCSLFVLR